MITLYFDKFNDMKSWIARHYKEDEAFVNNFEDRLTISFFLSGNVFVLRCLETYDNKMLERLPFETIYWGEVEET